MAFKRERGKKKKRASWWLMPSDSSVFMSCLTPIPAISSDTKSVNRENLTPGSVKFTGVGGGDKSGVTLQVAREREMFSGRWSSRCYQCRSCVGQSNYACGSSQIKLVNWRDYRSKTDLMLLAIWLILCNYIRCFLTRWKHSCHCSCAICRMSD